MNKHYESYFDPKVVLSNIFWDKCGAVRIH